MLIIILWFLELSIIEKNGYWRRRVSKDLRERTLNRRNLVDFLKYQIQIKILRIILNVERGKLKIMLASQIKCS